MNTFKPGKYRVKIKDSGIGQSKIGWRFCRASCELLAILKERNDEEMEVGQQYLAFFNIDNPYGFHLANEFCMACGEAVMQLDEEAILAIFASGGPEDSVLDVECRPRTTKMGHEFLEMRWCAVGSPYRVQAVKVINGDPS